ncbi:MAG: dihydroorotase [Actinomycetota bacterium]
MSEIVLKGGVIVDKTGERHADIGIGDDGRITEIGEGLSAPKTIDVTGQIVSSGFVDLNAHFSQPGNEKAETFETGTRSAVKGGFTAVVAMPDTENINDDADTARSIMRLGETALCHVEIAGAITMGNQGEQIAPLSEMAALGVRHFADPLIAGESDLLIRRAMEYSQRLGVTLHYGCSGGGLSPEGQMNEGTTSSRLGISGIPKENEEIEVFRLCSLAKMTGARVHLQQIANAQSVELIAEAQAEGAKVTCEVSPHHFALTEVMVESFEARYKVLPPLMTQENVNEMQKLLHEGKVDAIATGHRPCENHLKEQPFQEAPFGTIGFETALGASITYLNSPLSAILNLLSWRPAEIAGLKDTHGGEIIPGRPGNLTVFDPQKTWVVNGTEMLSKSSSSVFEGIQMKGLVSHTLVDGKLVVIDGEIQNNGSKR